jgi:hypothetical protein
MSVPDACAACGLHLAMGGPLRDRVLLRAEVRGGRLWAWHWACSRAGAPVTYVDLYRCGVCNLELDSLEGCTFAARGAGAEARHRACRPNDPG